MGKLCMESWVPPSRQGSPADVGRGTRSSPRGKRALYLAATRTLLSRGREMPGQPGFCLRSITVGDKRRESILQGAAQASFLGQPRAFGGTWSSPGASLGCA